MNNCVIDGITNIDLELIEKYLYYKSKRPIKKKQYRTFRLTTTVIAACLLVSIGLSFIIQYIPKEYDLEYYSIYDTRDLAFKKKSVWIYYTDNYNIKRERVYLPNHYYGRFVAWRYLSGIGEDVELVDYQLTNIPADSAIYNKKKHYHYTFNAPDDDRYIVYVTLSKDIISYFNAKNEEALMLSLQKTIIESSKLNISDVYIIIDNKELIRKDYP